jgi:hypothetical protein
LEEAFDSLESAFAAMARNERIANNQVLDEQRSITWGCCFLRLYPDDYAGETLAIFGIIPDYDAHQAELRRLCANDNEYAYEITTHEDLYERGYRVGQCYSVVCPDGEYGSTHISTMQKITPELFELARRCDWVLDRWLDVLLEEVA